MALEKCLSRKVKEYIIINFVFIKITSKNRYKFREKEALNLQDFLLRMLHPQPEKRATASEMLSHPWLQEEDNLDVKMSDEEH